RDFPSPDSAGLSNRRTGPCEGTSFPGTEFLAPHSRTRSMQLSQGTSRDSMRELRLFAILDELSGNPCPDLIWTDVTRHYGACANDRAIPNGDSFQHADAASEPTILSDHHRFNNRRLIHNEPIAF